MSRAPVIAITAPMLDGCTPAQNSSMMSRLVSHGHCLRRGSLPSSSFSTSAPANHAVAVIFFTFMASLNRSISSSSRLSRSQAIARSTSISSFFILLDSASARRSASDWTAASLHFFVAALAVVALFSFPAAHAAKGLSAPANMPVWSALFKSSAYFYATRLTASSSSFADFFRRASAAVMERRLRWRTIFLVLAAVLVVSKSARSSCLATSSVRSWTVPSRTAMALASTSALSANSAKACDTREPWVC